MKPYFTLVAGMVLYNGVFRIWLVLLGETRRPPPWRLARWACLCILFGSRLVPPPGTLTAVTCTSCTYVISRVPVQLQGLTYFDRDLQPVFRKLNPAADLQNGCKKELFLHVRCNGRN